MTWQRMKQLSSALVLVSIWMLLQSNAAAQNYAVPEDKYYTDISEMDTFILPAGELRIDTPLGFVFETENPFSYDVTIHIRLFSYEEAHERIQRSIAPDGTIETEGKSITVFAAKPLGLYEIYLSTSHNNDSEAGLNIYFPTTHLSPETRAKIFIAKFIPVKFQRPTCLAPYGTMNICLNDDSWTSPPYHNQADKLSVGYRAFNHRYEPIGIFTSDIDWVDILIN